MQKKKQPITLLIVLGVIITLVGIAGLLGNGEYPCCFIPGVILILVGVWQFNASKEEIEEESRYEQPSTTSKKKSLTKKESILVKRLRDFQRVDSDVNIIIGDDFATLVRKGTVAKTKAVFNIHEQRLVNVYYSLSIVGWVIIILLFPISVLFYIWHKGKEKDKMKTWSLQCLSR